MKGNPNLMVVVKTTAAKRIKKCKTNLMLMDLIVAGVEEQETVVVVDARKETPWPPPAPAAVADVTVEDGDTLDCDVCYHPLKPPIYQCEVGHVVCAPCHDRTTPTSTCHVCHVPVTGGAYRRCHAMERLVSSIHVACPHAAHGCAATPAYHDLESHLDTCPHAPNFHCPGDGCGFVGSTTALLAHFATAHAWPCHTRTGTAGGDTYSLDDGFNFLGVVHHHDAAAGVDRLVMINMTCEPYGRAISVHCIHPNAAAVAAAAMRCEIRYESRVGYYYGGGDDGAPWHGHVQKSVFDVRHSDLAGGLPDPKQGFQFILPSCVMPDDGEGFIRIHVRMIVIN